MVFFLIIDVILFASNNGDYPLGFIKRIKMKILGTFIIYWEVIG